MTIPKFESDNYTVEEQENSTGKIEYRAYRNIPYVSNPVDLKLQVINIFIPTSYFENMEINGYNAKTAPIFFTNAIGGYMEAMPRSPFMGKDGYVNAEAAALMRGYVVISPGARGRTTHNGEKYIGKAPACIVDLKAAVRFVRKISDSICGNTDRIISNGTSAGGAMSALLAASGNSPLYEPYLKELGAEDESDAIFAASCYCPITNLENADYAYEWQYGSLCKENEEELSEALGKMFVPYLNSIRPNSLTLDENGEGSFKEYIKELIIQSAERAIGKGAEIPEDCGVNTKEKTVNFDKYCEFITRMKPVGAFDSPNMATPENQLFGNENIDRRHFVIDDKIDDKNENMSAPRKTVELMNVMSFIDNKDSADYWRIRHGASDRDTSFAISAMLAQCLVEKGKNVDYHLPWGTWHSGDYDLDELFAWIDGIV